MTAFVPYCSATEPPDRTHETHVLRRERAEHVGCHAARLPTAVAALSQAGVQRSMALKGASSLRTVARGVVMGERPAVNEHRSGHSGHGAAEPRNRVAVLSGHALDVQRPAEERRGCAAAAAHAAVDERAWDGAERWRGRLVRK